jgi:RNA polymerase sigma factor (sigma-70 family)
MVDIEGSAIRLKTLHRLIGWTVGRYFVGSKVQTSDMVQEGWLVLISRLHSYNPEKEFSTWAVVVLRRALVRYTQKECSGQKPFEEEVKEEEDVRVSKEAEPLEKECTKESLHKYLLLLSPLAWKFLCLQIQHYPNTCSVKQLSQQLHVPAWMVHQIKAEVRLVGRWMEGDR